MMLVEYKYTLYVKKKTFFIKAVISVSNGDIDLLFSSKSQSKAVQLVSVYFVIMAMLLMH